MAHYVILRGIDRFFTEYNTYPGHFDERLEPDIVELKVKTSTFYLKTKTNYFF